MMPMSRAELIAQAVLWFAFGAAAYLALAARVGGLQ